MKKTEWGKGNCGKKHELNGTETTIIISTGVKTRVCDIIR